MRMIFFPIDASTPMAGALCTPSLVGHQARASSHGSALRWTHLQGGFCLLPVARSLCGSCDAQRGTWRTPGSAKGGLHCFYGGVELVEQYKDTGAQGRIKANGLQLSAFL